MIESSKNLGCGGKPTSGGVFLPPFREVRKTKKARFRDEEVAGDNLMQVSYKETLVNSSQAEENGLGGRAVD